MINKVSLLVFYGVIMFSCQMKSDENIDFGKLRAFNENSILQAVIEIPAGTNHKIEYDYGSNSFKNDMRNGMERVITFLPYPGNYGFIPGTISDSNLGGDGDALDVLILSEALKTGLVKEIKVVGLLKLIDNNEEDFKVIAIPYKKQERIIDVENFKQLEEKFPELIKIIEQWFLSYDKTDPARIEGWGDEIEANNYIEKSIK